MCSFYGDRAGIRIFVKQKSTSRRRRCVSASTAICLRVNFSVRITAINKKGYTMCSLNGDRAGIRTQDPQLRRLLLYPAELPDRPYLWQCLIDICGAKVVTLF